MTPRVTFYVFAIIIIITIILAASNTEPQINPKEMCRRNHGTWVIREEMQVTTIWDGYSYVPMTTWYPVGSCEVYRSIQK
jgi:energy-converting hydrogenase Eha subunit H